ncbi:MAG TPA: hypothetical protein VEB86_01055 [Chryseosolibacter sp.]|nr:hypothetical protein [Chryseosolibacter sp.]
MEHALVNELIKLLCKAGGETFVGNFQKDVNQDGEHDKWTPDEIAEAVEHVRYMNEYFGKDEAVAIITSLIAKYNVDVNDLALRPANRTIPLNDVR